MRELIASIIACIILVNFYVPLCIASISNNSETGVEIINEITMLDSSHAQMIYTIKTPKIIHYDFILALDSSGSFGETITQHEAIVKDIPAFLNNVQRLYPDAFINISIVSWDDNIDFVYDEKGKFLEKNNLEPLKIKLAPIENVTNEIEKFNTLYKCGPTEQTDFSVPIRASLDILGDPENAPKDKYGSRRFILLVTGNGEFKPCVTELVKEANEKYDGIYIVGLDIGPNSELENYLRGISFGGINPRIGPSVQGIASSYLSIKTLFGSNLEASLEDALLTHFTTIMNESVAYDTTISDRLFSYYEPDLESLRITSDKASDKAKVLKGYPSSARLEDNTTEIKIKIPSLLPNSTTKIVINIENTFNPSDLPVTISETDAPLVICSPIKRPDPSLTYIWFTGDRKNIILEAPNRLSSRNRLSIKSVELNENSKRMNTISIKIIELLFHFRR